MTIIIGNQEGYASKVAMLRAGGADKLHIVSDFDKTLTRTVRPDGQPSKSTIALLRENNYLGDDYVRESYALFDTYHPYEIDSGLSLEEKVGKMDAWWQEHLDLMILHGLRREIVDDMVARDLVPGREGLGELLRLSHEYGVPFLIFSAGLGDVIEGYLSKHDWLFSNVHVIANMYAYDADGKVTGYRSPIVHTFNKSEVQLAQSPYASEVRSRPNVLLLGDSLGDLGMVSGLDHAVCLSIGFLNGREELRGAYVEAFDVVVEEDGDLSAVNSLLRDVV